MVIGTGFRSKNYTDRHGRFVRFEERREKIIPSVPCGTVGFNRAGQRVSRPAAKRRKNFAPPLRGTTRDFHLRPAFWFSQSFTADIHLTDAAAMQRDHGYPCCGARLSTP
jgi:hypothetical protein